MKYPPIILLIGVAIFCLGCASHKPAPVSAAGPVGDLDSDTKPSSVALAAPIESSGDALLDSCDACFSGSFTKPGAEQQACLELVDYGPHEEDSERSDTDAEKHRHTARLIVFDENGRQVVAAPLDDWWSDDDGSKQWSLDGLYPLCGPEALDALVVYMFSEEGVCPDTGTETLAIYSFADLKNPGFRIWDRTGTNVSPVEYGDGFLSISYIGSDPACGEGDKPQVEPVQIRLECRDGEIVERPSLH